MLTIVHSTAQASDHTCGRDSSQDTKLVGGGQRSHRIIAASKGADGMNSLWQKATRKVCTLRDLDHSRGSSATRACSMSAVPAERARLVGLPDWSCSSDMEDPSRDQTTGQWGVWNALRSLSPDHAGVFKATKQNEGRLIIHGAHAANIDLLHSFRAGVPPGSHLRSRSANSADVMFEAREVSAEAFCSSACTSSMCLRVLTDTCVYGARTTPAIGR